jgi:predicted nucleic-acid-binding Zn-ribbon protein
MTAKWQCPKCECADFEADEIAVTGSGLSKIFDVQNRKFTAVTCTRCSYTEFYRADTSTLGNVFDFFTN